MDEENEFTMAGSTKIIKLKAKGVIKNLRYSSAGPCQLISNAVGIDEDDDDNDEPEGDLAVDLGNRIEPDALDKVIEWLDHYSFEPQTPIYPVEGVPIPNSFNENVPQEWYRNFMYGMDRSMMYSVRAAADFMSIEPLYSLTNVWMTFELVRMNVDEMHEFLGIEPMPAADRAQMDADYPWMAVADRDPDGIRNAFEEEEEVLAEAGVGS